MTTTMQDNELLEHYEELKEELNALRDQLGRVEYEIWQRIDWENTGRTALVCADADGVQQFTCELPMQVNHEKLRPLVERLSEVELNMIFIPEHEEWVKVPDKWEHGNKIKSVCDKAGLTELYLASREPKSKSAIVKRV